jgi:hypothetical protein
MTIGHEAEHPGSPSRNQLDGKLQYFIHLQSRHSHASMPQLHQELLKMAIEDERLAEVWPPLEPDLSPEHNRQYLYANLMINHHWLCLRTGDYTDEQVERNLRYLFRSRLMRKYWRAASTARRYLVPGTDEFSFSQLADDICHEYEAVMPSERPVNGGMSSAASPHSVAHWENLDTSPSAGMATT